MLTKPALGDTFPETIFATLIQTPSQNGAQSKIQRPVGGCQQIQILEDKTTCCIGRARGRWWEERREGDPSINKRPFGKKGPKHAHGHEHKKKDISEIQCFNCGEFGHYASQCPHEKRKRKQHASVADMDNIPRKKAKEPDLKDLADGIREGFF